MLKTTSSTSELDEVILQATESLQTMLGTVIKFTMRKHLKKHPDEIRKIGDRLSAKKDDLLCMFLKDMVDLNRTTENMDVQKMADVAMRRSAELTTTMQEFIKTFEENMSV